MGRVKGGIPTALGPCQNLLFKMIYAFENGPLGNCGPEPFGNLGLIDAGQFGGAGGG